MKRLALEGKSLDVIVETCPTIVDQLFFSNKTVTPHRADEAWYPSRKTYYNIFYR